MVGRSAAENCCGAYPRDVVPLFRSVLSFILHTKPHVVKLIICDLKSKRTDERTEPSIRKETIHE